jgi:parallel beta-helix repeat protein
MNEFPRQELTKIITENRFSLDDDPKRCRALLNDLCGDYRREINVLLSALEERIPTELLSNAGRLPPDTLLRRLSRHLEDERALTVDAARWAVESWALALGIITAPVSPARPSPPPVTTAHPPRSPFGNTQPPPVTDITVPAGYGLAQAVASAPVGATLHLQEGVHKLVQPLIIEKSLTLHGSGMDATRIVCAAAGCVIKFQGMGRYGLQDLSIDPHGSEVANVIEVADGEVAFYGCRFTGGVWGRAQLRGGNGIWLGGHTRGHITACWCIKNGMHGISVNDDAQTVLEGNTCCENSYSGITYAGNAAGHALNNTCNGNYDGISVNNQAQPVLEGNTCCENAYDGICYSGNTAGRATNNICIANKRYGIVVPGQAQPVLESNTCQDNGRKDICDYRLF